MSKVSITIDLDRYICTELEDVREMINDLDFSGLKASVERIQRHANSMESALRNYNQYMGDIKAIFDGKRAYYTKDTDDKPPLTDSEKLEAIKKVLEKKYHDNW